MKLVGCINKLSSNIQTRFFFVNQETGEVYDVTLELCEAIDVYNETARKVREEGRYSMIIPYEYKNGMADYSFGCGLSHYLQAEEFKTIEQRLANAGKQLSFPLSKCVISMYTPNDVKHILSCKNVFDSSIVEALKIRYTNKTGV